MLLRYSNDDSKDRRGVLMRRLLKCYTSIANSSRFADALVCIQSTQVNLL